jgi:hypothetical protein
MDKREGVDELAERFGMDANDLNFRLTGIKSFKPDLHQVVTKEVKREQVEKKFNELRTPALVLKQRLDDIPNSMKLELFNKINPDLDLGSFAIDSFMSV